MIPHAKMSCDSISTENGIQFNESEQSPTNNYLSTTSVYLDFASYKQQLLFYLIFP